MKDRTKVINQFSLYIEYTVFNIVSILCLITLVNNSEKVTDQTLKVAKKYIENTCDFKYPNHKNKAAKAAKAATQKGGRLGSATFLGAEEPMYNANNPTNDILPVDFQTGIARPQIGGKSSNDLNKIIKTIIISYINHILSHHNVKASKAIKDEIFDICKFHVNCMINCIKSKKVVNITVLKECVNKHKVLHALK